MLGPVKLETDKLVRTLGIREVAQRPVESPPAEARVALKACSDGVNAFFASSHQAVSPEFLVLGGDPRPAARASQCSDEADSAGWTLMMALDLGGGAGNEVARRSALQVLDTKQLSELVPPYLGERPASATDLAKLYRDQRIHAPDYPHFLTQDWAPPYRQDRIEALLARTSKHGVASFQTMHADLHSTAV